MPDRLRTRPVPRMDPLVASAHLITQTNLTDRSLFQDEAWQDEAWGFMDSLGEFNFGVTWLSQSLSRVRLLAAEQAPGGDEPVPLEAGPAVDLIEQLGGGIAGRAALMESLGVQLSVPGEGWLVAERESTAVPLDQADWSVKSTDEIRGSTSRGALYDIRVGDADWRPAFGDSLVSRVFRPHKRWSWKADSSARAAIPILREIDMYNRRIIATLVSRLAMNGLLLIPQEGMIITPSQYQDYADPFIQMLIEIAGNNIKNPGGATASIPIPIRYPADMIDKWKHLTFGEGIDKDLLEAREKAIGRLATTLNMPAEVLKGVGSSNHWSAWILEEAGIKLHISPVAEVIVGGITTGYLQPMLEAARESLVGPAGGKIVCWYDASELTARPDKSAQAKELYDRVELSGAALRRESGLDEGDKPDPAEMKEQLLKKLALSPQTSAQAYEELTGEALPAPVTGTSQPGGPGGDVDGTPATSPGDVPVTGPPTTRDAPPPEPDPAPPTPAPAQVGVNGHRPVIPAGRR